MPNPVPKKDERHIGANAGTCKHSAWLDKSHSVPNPLGDVRRAPTKTGHHGKSATIDELPQVAIGGNGHAIPVPRRVPCFKSQHRSCLAGYALRVPASFTRMRCIVTKSNHTLRMNDGLYIRNAETKHI